MLFPLSLLAFLLNVPKGCLGSGGDLVLIPLSRLGFPLPHSLTGTHLHFSSPLGDKKMFVRSAREFRPVFLAFAMLDAPYLYVDKFNNIRSIDRAFVMEFLRRKLITQLRKNRTQGKPTELQIVEASKETAFKLSTPVDRSLRIGRDSFIFEYCHELISTDDKEPPRCIYFMLSEIDDQLISLDCLKLSRLFSPRIRISSTIIVQLNWPETLRIVEMKKKSGLCKRVERGDNMDKHSRAKAVDKDKGEAMERENAKMGDKDNAKMGDKDNAKMREKDLSNEKENAKTMDKDLSSALRLLFSEKAKMDGTAADEQKN